MVRRGTSSDSVGIATYMGPAHSQTIAPPIFREVGQSFTSLVERAVRALGMRGALESGRVLVFEPRSNALGSGLRGRGFAGERHALLRRPLPEMASLRLGYDHISIHDWVDDLHCDGTSDTLSDPTGSPPSPASNLGTFDLIMVKDASRLAGAQRLKAILVWLASFLAQRGLLVIGEPSPPVNSWSIETLLARHSLMLASDFISMDDDWSRFVAAFQRRAADEVRLIGNLRRVTLDDILSHPSLYRGITDAYRETFGGEEWREWIRCSRPECGRRYSQNRYALLDPPDQCECGWPNTLQLFHTSDSIRAKLTQELKDISKSCCYIRANPSGGVDGFAWGYLCQPADVPDRLLPTDDQAARSHLSAKIDELVRNTAHDDITLPIYYHSELGVIERARSLSLTRGLFHRSLEFAHSHGARVVLLRTSQRSSVYPLLTGLGMRIVHTYGNKLPSSVDGRPDAGGSVASDGVDARVILGGEIDTFLRIFTNDSDRRLAVRIAHGLRRGDRGRE